MRVYLRYSLPSNQYIAILFLGFFSPSLPVFFWENALGLKATNQIAAGKSNQLFSYFPTRKGRERKQEPHHQRELELRRAILRSPCSFGPPWSSAVIPQRLCSLHFKYKYIYKTSPCLFLSSSLSLSFFIFLISYNKVSYWIKSAP